jgi:hypothetical protein
MNKHNTKKGSILVLGIIGVSLASLLFLSKKNTQTEYKWDRTFTLGCVETDTNGIYYCHAPDGYVYALVEGVCGGETIVCNKEKRK